MTGSPAILSASAARLPPGAVFHPAVLHRNQQHPTRGCIGAAIQGDLVFLADGLHRGAVPLGDVPQPLAVLGKIQHQRGIHRAQFFPILPQSLQNPAEAAALQQSGINCGAMHSDLEQAERDDVMFKFKSGQYDVLVATDIVARGIDIDDIEMVINYDVPHDTEDYVHRIGRTARANRDGRAITFVNEEDQYWFQQIEKFLEKVVEKMPLPEECGEGPEYIKLNKPKKKDKGNGRGGNGRKQGGKGRGRNGDNRNKNNGGNKNNGENKKNGENKNDAENGNEGNNGNSEGKTKTSAKSRRQKDRDQTSHKHKPNKPSDRQEKAPRNNGENGEQQNASKDVKQQNAPKGGKPQNNQQGAPQNGEQKNNNNKRRNNNNNKRRNDENGNQQPNGNQRPGAENNVRPGSNGRGRGVAQKKQNTEGSGNRKYAPVVNPQKNENVVKKFIKRIFGFGK